MPAQLPSSAESVVAQSALRALSSAKTQNEQRMIVKGGKQVEVTLPARVFEMLLDVLRHTAEGNAVTIVPLRAELTTQQAADLLSVSRPHLIKLLNQGELPFTRTGRHRRVLAEDVFAFKTRRAAKSREALENLAELAHETDVGDDW